MQSASLLPTSSSGVSLATLPLPPRKTLFFILGAWQLRNNFTFSFLLYCSCYGGLEEIPFYTICILSAISLLLAEWGWRSAPTANFYLLPTRAWELGVGSICALLIYKRPQKTSSFLSFTGLALIVFSIFFYDKTIPFPSVYALAPVGGTALIILYGTSSTLTARFLSMKFMVGIGLISFSAYLWHQPLLAFSRIRYESDPSWQLLLFLSVASIFLAYLTWKYIEQPFRNKKATNKNTIPRKAIFGYSVLASTLFASSGLYGYMSNGLPSRRLLRATFSPKLISQK